MTAVIYQFVPRPNLNRDPDYPNLPASFCESYRAMRNELLNLVPFAKSGGPITDHREPYVAPDQDPA